jgi:hypothetical protein
MSEQLELKSNLHGGGDPNPLPAKKPAKRSAPKQAEAVKRRKILLEDNEHIPPTGQFFSVNGRAYILEAGKPVDVPEEIVSVLNDAVQTFAITNSAGEVIGYRDRLRFPFRSLD